MLSLSQMNKKQMYYKQGLFAIAGHSGASLITEYIVSHQTLFSRKINAVPGGCIPDGGLQLQTNPSWQKNVS